MIEKLKITVSSNDRIVIIPIEIDSENQTLDLKELQIEPVPEKDEDISNDLTMFFTELIINAIRN